MIQRTHAATWRAGGDVTRLHPCSLKPSTLRFHISNELRIVVEHGRGIRVPSRRLTSKVSVVWLARQVLIESLEHLRGRRAPAALGYLAPCHRAWIFLRPPLGLRGGESFLGPFRDQVPLHLGEQFEQGDHDLGLQVLLAVELDPLLDRALPLVLGISVG